MSGSTSTPLGWLGIARLGLVQLSLGAVVVLTTSTLMGPLTIEQISSISGMNSFPVLAIRLGLVVTPSMSPSRFASLISSIIAVSIKIFMASPSAGRRTVAVQPLPVLS